MRFLHALVLLFAGLTANSALAWGNHSLAAYRAFEYMPEVGNAANTVVETLESFLRAEEYTVEALLASQEAWAVANIEKYPVRPATLAFRADPARSDDARRLAFLHAMRVAPDSRFALYYQPDPWGSATGVSLPFSAVSTQPEPAGAGYRLLALKPGDNVAALVVLASAADEPDYGQDINLWEDNASEWARIYGFGPQPYGNPGQAMASQLPFHTSFMHESRLVSLGMPSIKRNLVLFRSHQFSTLAALAFRTGHSYWGWRFAGMSLHYLQELTQPYQASWAPGETSMRILSVHMMALSGMPGPENDLQAQQVRRQGLLDRYLDELLRRAAANRQEGAIEKALHNMEKDKAYPDWNDRYLREVASAQAARGAPALAQTLVAAFPASHLADSGAEGPANATSLLADMPKRETTERQRLDASLTELMANFAAHSRNALRGILRASDPF